MKTRRKLISVAVVVLGLCLTGCGEDGGRKVQSTNAVESVIDQQIAKENARTETEKSEALVTETPTEPVTEAPKTEAPVTEAPTTEASSVLSTETWEEINKRQKEEAATITDEQLMGEIRDSYESTPDPDVDIDFTAMSSDMVYATVYQMCYVDPKPYEGKVFKAKGTFAIATSNITNLYYSYVVIKDALACCASGVEFQWEKGGEKYPDDYPADGTEIEVIGTFESYTEEGDPNLYTHLKNAKMTILSKPETKGAVTE